VERFELSNMRGQVEISRSLRRTSQDFGQAALSNEFG
jgi:hypothetical protein